MVLEHNKPALVKLRDALDSYCVDITIAEDTFLGSGKYRFDANTGIIYMSPEEANGEVSAIRIREILDTSSDKVPTVRQVLQATAADAEVQKKQPEFAKAVGLLIDNLDEMIKVSGDAPLPTPPILIKRRVDALVEEGRELSDKSTQIQQFMEAIAQVEPVIEQMQPSVSMGGRA